jgi:hypothetical protein
MLKELGKVIAPADVVEPVVLTWTVNGTSAPFTSRGLEAAGMVQLEYGAASPQASETLPENPFSALNRRW